jgi:hypothetical protein
LGVGTTALTLSMRKSFAGLLKFSSVKGAGKTHER